MNTRNIIPLPWVRGGAAERGATVKIELGDLARGVLGSDGNIAIKLTRLMKEAAAGALLTAEEFDLVNRVRSGALAPPGKRRGGAAKVSAPSAPAKTAAPVGGNGWPVRFSECASGEIQVRMGRLNSGLILNSPAAALRAWSRYIEPAAWYSPERENLVVMVLNNRLELMGWALCGVGTANECLACPRDILRPVVASGATHFVLMHNHPSGYVQPSGPDRDVTRGLKEICKVLGCGFLDHIIVGTAGPVTCEGYYSASENGELARQADPRQ